MTYAAIQPDLRALGPVKFARRINDAIRDQEIDLLWVEPGWCEGFNSEVMQIIDSRPFKVLIDGDSNLSYERTSIMGLFFDLVLSGDYLMMMNFRNIGFNCELLPTENCATLYTPLGLEQDLDVLFSGFVDKENRKQWLTQIAKAISPFELEIIESAYTLNSSEHNLLLNKARIIINLTSSTVPKVGLQHARGSYTCPSPRALKGRCYSGFLAGSAVVSEYFASADLMLPGLRTFHTPQEAAYICQELLNDPDQRHRYVEQNRQLILEHYTEERMVSRIVQSINSIQNSEFGRTVRLNKVWSSRYRSKGVRHRSADGNLLKNLINEYSFLNHLNYTRKRYFQVMFWVLPDVIAGQFATLLRKFKQSLELYPLVGTVLQKFTSSRRNRPNELTQ